MATKKDLVPDHFKTDMFKDIRKLINIIDQIRDYGLDKEIALPRIAVLGTQSSGKSSLLENIVGLDFLPRGSGVVTRRPLELRLVHLDPRKYQGPPYAVFENDNDPDKGKRFTDFNLVKEHIQKVTDLIAGTSGIIVDDPIKLRVYSNDCPDLTIVDLPGITRIDIKGQKNIQKITTDMAKKYCLSPETIILCVIPGNQDLATSDGLKYARDWDPTGERTIGVITKIDIMDKGTSAKRMLMNEEIRLKLGYIGIVNRAQQDINNRVTVDVAIKRETEFFKSRPEYRDLPPQLLGTQSLTAKLSEQLIEAIKRSLPSIFKQISERLEDLEDKLADLGQPPPSSLREKSNFLMNLTNQFSNDYKNTLSGKYVANTKKGSDDFGKGALIRRMFKNIFVSFPRTYCCSKDYDDNYLKNSIRSHQGDQIEGFPSLECFKSLLVPQLEKLREPIQSTLNEVFQQLTDLAGYLIEKVFGRFSEILALANDVTLDKLSQLKTEAEQILDNLLEAETLAVFTNDVSYLSARSDLLAKAALQSQTPEKIFLNEIRERLDNYFKIVVRVLDDSVPKIIGFYLVRQSQESLPLVLFNQLNQEHVFELLGQPKEVQEQRKDFQSRINTLRKSQKSLKMDPTVARIIDYESDD